MRLYNMSFNMFLFRGKYRIKSIRLPKWDYSSDRLYFVTICIRIGEMPFGYVLNGEMRLSKLGHVAKKCWLEIPVHFPFVRLDEFIIMPNHTHGIIEINKNNRHVETQNFASLRRYDHKFNTFGPQSKNLASIIRGFKIGVKKYANMNNDHFSWQPRFHDHIIRGETDLNRIREYIINNPAKWDTDEYNPIKYK